MTCIKEKFLFVDDDHHILDGFRRRFRGKVDLSVAESAHQGLELIDQLALEQEHFAVIVSDMKMPGMDGSEFLKVAKEKSPKSVRLMLTGESNLESAMAAVNTGEVFRFLLKPCSAEVLGDALVSSLEQYRLKMLEAYFFDETLTGVVKLLTNFIEYIHPDNQLRTKKIKAITDFLLDKTGIKQSWDINVCIMLLGLPSLLLKESADLAYTHQQAGLAKEIQEQIDYVKSLVTEKLSHIPKLDGVSRLLVIKNLSYELVDSESYQSRKTEDDLEAVTAQLIRIAEAFVLNEESGKGVDDIIDQLSGKTGDYDPTFIEMLRFYDPEKAGVKTNSIRIAELEEGMEIAQEIQTNTGLVLVKAGMFANKALMNRLANYCGTGLIHDHILIYE